MMRLAPKKHLYSAMSAGLWLCAAIFFASSAKATLKPTQTESDFATQTASPFALADFDGDQQLDIATVQVGQTGASDTHYWIHFRLSSGVKQFIPLTAPLGGLRIASRDVNGDSFVDLIVTTALQELPVAVLLNDGRGNFTARDPHGFPSVMSRAPTSASVAPGNTYEIATALLPRHESGRCNPAQGFTSPRQRTTFTCASASPHKNVVLAGSVLGRAPPVSFLHV